MFAMLNSLSLQIVTRFPQYSFDYKLYSALLSPRGQASKLQRRGITLHFILLAVVEKALLSAQFSEIIRLYLKLIMSFMLVPQIPQLEVCA